MSAATDAYSKIIWLANHAEKANDDDLAEVYKGLLDKLWCGMVATERVLVEKIFGDATDITYD